MSEQDEPSPEAPSLDAIHAARERIDSTVVRTPLLRLDTDSPSEIYVKLECLQPIGSFKLRGASNLMLQADPSALAAGAWTASAGNMAQGVAWCARKLGVPCTVVVPDTAPQTKRAAVERLGGRILPVPREQWFEVFRTRRFPGMDGLFVHAFSDSHVMAGNGTIGLEILEDLPDVETVIVPYGGGGLVCGIASAIRAVKPSVRVFAAEVDTGAPLAASWSAGEPVEVTYTSSFVDGISSPHLFPEMWQLARRLLDGSLVSPLSEVAAAVRLLAQRARVVAEGAGAASVACALRDGAGAGKVVCIVSGGNIDAAKLATILQGGVP